MIAGLLLKHWVSIPTGAIFPNFSFLLLQMWENTEATVRLYTFS